MLNQDYKEMLSTLQECRVEFLLVGAYAMAAHGFPRATADMDVLVRPTPENAKRVYNAIVNFGAPVEGISIKDFETPGTIFQIGVAPRRIDIINYLDGVSFEDAEKEKNLIHLEGLQIPVISKRHLIINKKSTGRIKDKLDAETLEKTKER